MASLADAEEALRSTSAKANFQRLTRLLMCGGLRLLREIFDSIHPPADLPLRLRDPTIQTHLRGARLTQPERDCLNPSTGVYGKSTDFDITLIFKLLRTICNLTPPPGPRGWDDLPNSSDHSLVADLIRIKYYRNEVYGHSRTMEITDTEFNDLWGKISEILIRIAAAISREKKDEWKKSIDGFLLDALTPEEERYNEELDTWYNQDMDVKSEVKKLRTEISDVKEVVAKQSQQIATLVVKITAQAGSPTISNQPSSRPQVLQEAGESRGISAIPIPDQERAEDDGSDSGELQLNPLDSPTEIQIWTVIISFKKSFELFFQYLAYKLHIATPKHDLGSLLITAECSSLPILEGLWEDYCSGHLNAIAQEMLVTAEVLEKLRLTDVRLKTFISEEEYEKGKQILMDHSECIDVVVPGDKREVFIHFLGDPISPIEIKRKDNGEQSQKKSDTSTEVQHKGKRKKRKKRQKPASSSGYTSVGSEGKETGRALLPLDAASTTFSPVASIEDHLVRISNLEEENRKLKRRLNAVENALQGKTVSRKIDQLMKKNLELEKRLAASENARVLSYFELKELKQEVYSIKMNMEVTREVFPHSSASSGALASRPFRSSRRKGVCQVIVMRQELEALDEEKEEFESVFKDLGFYVDEEVCESNDDVGRVLHSVARRVYGEDSLFVCFVQSSVTGPMSLIKLLRKFKMLQHEMIKIVIIQGHQTTTAFEAGLPYDYNRQLLLKSSFTEDLPDFGEDFLYLFVPHRKGYISTLLSVIRLPGSKPRDILDILSEAKKLFYEKSHITIPDPVHNLKGPVYLSQET